MVSALPAPHHRHSVHSRSLLHNFPRTAGWPLMPSVVFIQQPLAGYKIIKGHYPHHPSGLSQRSNFITHTQGLAFHPYLSRSAGLMVFSHVAMKSHV